MACKQNLLFVFFLLFPQPFDVLSCAYRNGDTYNPDVLFLLHAICFSASLHHFVSVYNYALFVFGSVDIEKKKW